MVSMMAVGGIGLLRPRGSKARDLTDASLFPPILLGSVTFATFRQGFLQLKCGRRAALEPICNHDRVEGTYILQLNKCLIILVFRQQLIHESISWTKTCRWVRCSQAHCTVCTVPVKTAIACLALFISHMHTLPIHQLAKILVNYVFSLGMNKEVSDAILNLETTLLRRNHP